MRFDLAFRFDAPVERVFPYLAEPSRWHEWVAAVEERRQVGDGPVGVGTTWRSVDRIGPMRIRFTDELVDLEANRRVAWRHSAPWNAVTEYVCEPETGGARLTVHFEGRLSGRLWLLDLLPDRLAARAVVRDLDRLRKILTADATAPDGEDG